MNLILIVCICQRLVGKEWSRRVGADPIITSQIYAKSSIGKYGHSSGLITFIAPVDILDN